MIGVERDVERDVDVSTSILLRIDVAGDGKIMLAIQKIWDTFAQCQSAYIYFKRHPEIKKTPLSMEQYIVDNRKRKRNKMKPSTRRLYNDLEIQISNYRAGLKTLFDTFLRIKMYFDQAETLPITEWEAIVNDLDMELLEPLLKESGIAADMGVEVVEEPAVENGKQPEIPEDEDVDQNVFDSEN